MVTAFLTAIVVLVASSLVGNLTHRALHKRWSGPFYRAHARHHTFEYPSHDVVSDRYRKPPPLDRGIALFTPVFVGFCSVVISVCWLLGLPRWVGVEACALTFLFGLINDHVHDSFHLRRHYLQRFDWYRRLRRAHLRHHVDTRVNFGIVETVWDRFLKSEGRR